MSGSRMDRRAFLTATGVMAAGAVAAGVGWLVGGRDTVPPQPADSMSPTSRGPEPTTQRPPAPTSTTEATRPPSTTSTAAAKAPTVSVLCRQAWGAKPPAGNFREHDIDQITVHHTAVVLESNTEAPGTLRQHQSYHQGLGWPDIAYHYVIDAKGHIYEGRPTTAVGDTATDYDPTGHLLICCEGNFDLQSIGGSQYQALVSMLAWGVNEFGIAVPEVRGHRDLASTTCPGDNLHAAIADGSGSADILARAASSPRLEIECGPGAAEFVAAIEAGEI